ncbi:hypothetical protein [Bifidobacterium biavatii]|uniref:Uncharacterized protein n=1 Tax=Bifidobacterium biavatii DSM 23969 TaxID=1437608 RepID=A0A086ZWA3_9BIFI|nr:hypothetical protein [Bifidobacterium biavatii]KFI50803.1 hypothetical protein BBIA_1597 [Bifidobacterium biavatii DSM 23969]
MCNSEKPRSGSAMWLMALVVVTISNKIDPITADPLMMDITVYMMWRDSHSPHDELK